MKEILYKIIYYFLDDPLRILYLIGGSGGIFFWVDRYLNRITLRVELIDFGLSQYKPARVLNRFKIRFEVENLGTKPTSLEKTIKLKGFIPIDHQKKAEPRSRLRRYFYNYEIEPSSDRHLPPRKPKMFEAFSDRIVPNDPREFLRLMTYEFKPTRGKTHRIRFNSSHDKDTLSCVRYIYRLIRYAFTGKFYIGFKGEYY